MRVIRHELFLRGEIALQGVKPPERELIVVRHRNILNTGSIEERDPYAVTVKACHDLPEFLHELLDSRIVGGGGINAQEDVPAADRILNTLALVRSRRQKYCRHKGNDHARDGQEPEDPCFKHLPLVEGMLLEAPGVGGSKAPADIGLFAHYESNEADCGGQDPADHECPGIVIAYTHFSISSLPLSMESCASLSERHTCSGS